MKWSQVTICVPTRVRSQGAAVGRGSAEGVGSDTFRRTERQVELAKLDLSIGVGGLRWALTRHLASQETAKLYLLFNRVS